MPTQKLHLLVGIKDRQGFWVYHLGTFFFGFGFGFGLWFVSRSVCRDHKCAATASRRRLLRVLNRPLIDDSSFLGHLIRRGGLFSLSLSCRLQRAVEVLIGRNRFESKSKNFYPQPIHDA
jgi:hypothetical protein